MRRLTLCIAVSFLGLAAWAQEPPLPPGLDAPAPAPANNAPPLPPGLVDSAPASNAAEPALPPGLGEPTPAPADPALPPGLDMPAEDQAPAAPTEDKPPWFKELNLHGFWETRGGLRLQDDPAQSSDAILGETRFQLKLKQQWSRAGLDVTGDAIFDGVLEEADFDLRQFRLTWSPGGTVDIRMGRQVLTWGTGDLLFINDLFPKDWQSFLGGRDVEYLKAPADAIKIGWYPKFANFELVYTPQFTPDRYITGERVSFWNPMLGRHAGRDNEVRANPPSTWFENDEFAWRIYRSVGRTELAVYGYAGYWKSPGGQRLWPYVGATFPKLNVYGASLRTTLGKGVVNAELGYYDSRQDRKGGNAFVNNSEFRLLLGYERELGKNFTGGFQYYLEHMMDHSEYRRTLPFFVEPRDQNRHLLTMRLTKLLMNQNLTLSLFTYWSPSDQDAFMRPAATYKVNDHWTVQTGANVFLGNDDHTFFGQFENNSSVYAGARYSF